MKSPVIFRASFRDPQWAAIKVPCPIEVEIYRHSVGPPGEWRARRPGTRIEFTQITPQSRASTLMRQIEKVHFSLQLTPWAAFDKSCEPPELLKSDEWGEDTKGVVYLKEIPRERVKEREAKQAQERIHRRAQNVRELFE